MMLRFLYCAVLSAHPPYFRQRFADEMQAIFDQADSEVVRTRLLADAVISLARQWVFRPQFWEEPAPVAAEGGTALFSSLGSSKPRAVALFYGAILSALVLNGVSLTIGYAWEHPIFIEIRRPVIVPPAAWKSQQLVMKPGATVGDESYLYSDQGRVLLVFRSPAHPASQTQPAAKARSEADTPPVPLAEIIPSTEIVPPTTNNSVGIPAAVLQAYAGTYVNPAPDGPRVIVTIDNGHLQLDVAGQFRSPLAPLPNPQLLACGVGDCWVMFSTGSKGTVDRIEVHHLGREFVAFRAQSGMVF
jgi:hypothetical protein